MKRLVQWYQMESEKRSLFADIPDLCFAVFFEKIFFPEVFERNTILEHVIHGLEYSPSDGDYRFLGAKPCLEAVELGFVV